MKLGVWRAEGRVMSKRRLAGDKKRQSAYRGRVVCPRNKCHSNPTSTPSRAWDYLYKPLHPLFVVRLDFYHRLDCFHTFFLALVFPFFFYTTVFSLG